MTNFLKVTEAPATKLRLKKAILKGEIKVYEKDMNNDLPFNELKSVNCILQLWEGLRYTPKYHSQESIANAYLGTSFNYKFVKA
jgi:hypothetical protein